MMNKNLPSLTMDKLAVRSDEIKLGTSILSLRSQRGGAARSLFLSTTPSDRRSSQRSCQTIRQASSLAIDSRCSLHSRFQTAVTSSDQQSAR